MGTTKARKHEKEEKREENHKVGEPRRHEGTKARKEISEKLVAARLAQVLR